MTSSIKEIYFDYYKQADKFFKKHEDIREKFENNIKSVYSGNKNVNIKLMQGTKETIYRMKIADYRVIFKVVDGQIIIINTILAGNRGEIYKIFKR